MILENFHKWADHQKIIPTEANFIDFFDQHFYCMSDKALINHLALEIYQLQVCMEGLLEERDE